MMSALEQYIDDVKKALKELDCWGNDVEIAKFLKALDKYEYAIGNLAERCAVERPNRLILCQLRKGHTGSHQAAIFWEDERENEPRGKDAK